MRLLRTFSFAVVLLATNLPADAEQEILWVGEYWNRRVLKYDTTTRAYLGEFIPSEYGDLSSPEGMVMLSGGDVYVASVRYGGPHAVKRCDYDAGAFLGDLATGGLHSPRGFLLVSEPVTLSAAVGALALLGR